MQQASVEANAALSAISGKLDVAITRVEVAVSASERASDAAARTEAAVKDLAKVVRRMQNDQLAQRFGVPLSWTGRLAILAFCTFIGAATTMVVSACARETPLRLAP